MEKTVAVIFDIDGVVLDWFGSFCDWMEASGYKVNRDAHVDWNMIETFPDYEGDINNSVSEFNQSEHFAHLKYIDGAYWGVHELREIIPSRIPFVAITGAGGAPSTLRRRATALEDLPFDVAHILPLHMSKRFFLEEYAVPSIYVEDNLKHAITSADIGHMTLLINRDYNQSKNDPKNIMRVNDWNQIVESITNFCKTQGW